MISYHQKFRSELFYELGNRKQVKPNPLSLDVKVEHGNLQGSISVEAYHWYIDSWGWWVKCRVTVNCEVTVEEW